MTRLLRTLIACTVLFSMTLSLLGTPASAQGSALLDITLRGCPEGVDPHAGNPKTTCTVPLDAPDEAGVFWGGDGQGGMPMSDVDRLHDGTYRVNVPANTPVSLFNFEPSVRDDFLAVGADGVDLDGDPVITLGETALGHVTLYYYFDSAPATEATLSMTLRGCPDGFDAATDDFFENCTVPLDAPDAAVILWGGDGQGGMEISLLDRAYNGAYLYTAGPLTMSVDLTGLAPVVRDDYQVFGFDSVNGDTYTINLSPGESREVFVFYYFT